jgi:two-component system response regulator AtoC
VRELRNVLERALVLEHGPDLALDVLGSPGGAVAAREGTRPFEVSGPPITAEELEKRYARHVLAQLGGRRVEAARALGLSYPTFLKRIED